MSQCGAGAPAREMMPAEKNRNKVKVVRAVIMRPYALLIAALREIFEESAYERFLNRRGLTSSPRAYRDFLREIEATKARRPKCC